MQRYEVGPAPFLKLRIWTVDIDVRIFAKKAHREPLLDLAAIAALPEFRNEVMGQVVFDPVAFRQDLRLVGADLLLHLAEGSGKWIFCGIDPALRHLPGSRLHVAALGNEDLVLGIEQENSDTPAKGQGRELLASHDAARAGIVGGLAHWPSSSRNAAVPRNRCAPEEGLQRWWGFSLR